MAIPHFIMIWQYYDALPKHDQWKNDDYFNSCARNFEQIILVSVGCMGEHEINSSFMKPLEIVLCPFN